MRDLRMTPAERLVGVEIMAHLERDHGKDRDHIVVEDWEIAANLGVTRPFVNRTVAKLDRLGWFKREKARNGARKLRLLFKLKGPNPDDGSNPAATGEGVTQRSHRCNPAITPKCAHGHTEVRRGAHSLKNLSQTLGQETQGSEERRPAAALAQDGPPPPAADSEKTSGEPPAPGKRGPALTGQGRKKKKTTPPGVNGSDRPYVPPPPAKVEELEAAPISDALADLRAKMLAVASPKGRAALMKTEREMQVLRTAAEVPEDSIGQTHAARQSASVSESKPKPGAIAAATFLAGLKPRAAEA